MKEKNLPEISELDKYLMISVRGGDHNVFDEIVRKYQNWAWNVAFRFSGRREEAEDIVQESFLCLLTSAERYEPKASLKTYLYRIISTVCMDHAKKKRPIYTDKLQDIEDSGLSIDHTIIQNERNAIIKKTLETLPPNQRMAVVLRYYEELNYREIADSLKTTPKAVERLLARGRKNLLAVLSQWKEKI